MWVLNAIVLIVFHEASGLDNRIESFPSTSPEKMKSCPMLTSFDNGWTCSVTQQFVDKGGNRLGDGSTCKSIKDSSLPPFKCSDGIWKRVRVKRAMTNHFSSCPSNQYLQPSPGKICAVATWTPPREEVDRHSGGNPGDCFTAGDHEITYQYDGFWTWNWVSGDTCTFTIHVSVSYCQSPPALQNGHLSCTGEVNNVFGSVCSHHCNPGYILQGNPDVRCDSSWNTNFPTCAESCSWPKNHCWPGDCRNQLAVNCVCRPGFTKVQINGGNRCELNTPPNLNTCRVSVRSGSGEVTESKFVGNITSCENQRNEIIKSTPSELSFTMKADLNWTLVSFATYVSSSSVGVVGAKITLVKISVSGIEQIIHEQSLNDYSTNCRQNVNDTVPLPSNLQLDCDGTIQLPTYHLGDGESLCADMEAFSGGFYNLQDESHTHQELILFQRVSKGKRVCFLYDNSKPVHCSDFGCNKLMLQLSTRITRSPAIDVIVDGWVDPVPVGGSYNSSSHIDKFVLEVHGVDVNGSVLSVQQNAISTLTIEVDADPLSPINFNFTLPEGRKAPLYAVILEVHDRAENVGYARRLVLYDNSSRIELQESKTLNVTTANPSSDFKWQTDISQNICVDWRDRFYNNELNDFLKPVIEDTSREITGRYDQIDQPIAVSGTANVHGIVQFQIAWKQNNGSMTKYDNVVDLQAQRACITEPLVDGETYEIWIRATDVMGNTKEDNIMVNIDHSNPNVTIRGLRGRFDYEGLGVHNSTDLSTMVLVVDVLDNHSGIEMFSWTLRTLDTREELGTRAVGVQTITNTTNCTGREYCYCPMLGSCEDYRYLITFNNLIDNNTHNGLHHRDYYIIVTATNKAGLTVSSNINVLLDASPPSVGVVMEGFQDEVGEMDFTSDDVVHVYWHGFLDHESDVMLYRVALAPRCLTEEEMENSENVKSVEDGNDMLLEFPCEGTYFTNVIAYNRAMAPSGAACSDGITYDRSPPLLRNVSIVHARTGRTLGCTQPGQIWLVNTNMTRVRLAQTLLCSGVCAQNVSFVGIEHLPLSANYSMDAEVSTDLCERLKPLTEETPIVMPSDFLRMQWSAKDDQSDIDEFYVGIGQDRTSEMSPDIVPLTRTHGHPFYQLRHSGLGHGAVFFIFLQAVSKAGLYGNLTLGPVVIDVTPPQVTHTLTAITDGDFLSVTWSDGTFKDTEQPDGVDFDVKFRVGHEKEFVTPLMSLPETTLSQCRKNNITGCVRYPISLLSVFDTESGRSFFFQLHVSNAAGHVTTVNTSSSNLPVHLPPSITVVADVMKSSHIQNNLTATSPPAQLQTKDYSKTYLITEGNSDSGLSANMASRLSPRSAFHDVDVVIVPNEVCIAWSGFFREDSLHIQVGIGTEPNWDDLVPFDLVDTNPSCMNTSNLPAYTKLFSVIKASNPSGSSIFSSDGFYLIPRNDPQNMLQVFNGKGCTANNLIGSTVLKPNHSSFDFTLRTHVSIHPGDTIFIRFNPPIPEVTFKNAVVLQTTLNGYQLIAESTNLSGTLYNTNYLNTTVDVLSCMNDNILQRTPGDQVTITWEIFGPWARFVTFLKAEVVDVTCVEMSTKKDKYVKERCLSGRDNNVMPTKRTHDLNDASIVSGHVYVAWLSACTDYECFPAVSSFPVLYESTVQSIIVESAELITDSVQEMEIEINAFVESYVNMSALNRSCPFVFRWTVCRDKFGFIPVSLWRIHETSTSEYIKLRDVLRYNGSSQGTLYACIQPVYPWKQETPSCRRVTRPASIGQAELIPLHLIELSYEVLQEINVEEYINNEQPGSKLHDLYDLDLDFAKSDVTLSAILTGSDQRNVTWLLMAAPRMPVNGDCTRDSACLLAISSNNGKVVFPQTSSNVQNGLRYFICARVSSRTSTVVSFHGDTALEVCGDGFVIDDTPPESGAVAISNSNSGYLDTGNRVLVTWSGFSDVESIVDSLPDDVTIYFSIALGSYPGGEDISPFVQVGQRTSWTFEHLNLTSGTTCIATVKAEDRVGHVTQVSSDMVIIDTTPPKADFVAAGKITQDRFVSGMNVPVHWEGVEDQESGISVCEVALTLESVPDVIAFEHCHGNTAIIKGTALIVDGHSYIAVLKIINGAGLVTLISSEPFVIDSSPPSIGLVSNSAPNTSENMAYTTETGIYHTHWTGFSDPHSGLAFFRVGLGLQPDIADVRPLTFVGLQTSYVWEREFDQGRKYYTIVEACNQAGLCSMTSSRSITFDNSPPTPGIIVVGFDGHHSKFVGHNLSLPVQWLGFSDAQTGIEDFFWCVGLKPRLCDVTPFTPTLLSRATVGTGLSLPVGRRLYVTVRARNPAGLETMGVSDSFMVDITPPEVEAIPHFLSQVHRISINRQWDRSIFSLAWKFSDLESPVIRHTVSIRSHVTGRVVSEGLKLGAETEMTLLLDKDHLLMDGDLYGASVTACNAASLCTTATASLLLVDSTPPTVGTFGNPISWKKTQTNITSHRDNITDINVVLLNFADAESGVIAYYITAGRKYNGDDLSRGQIQIPCNSSTHNHNFNVSVHDELKTGDVVYLSVWAENNLGLPSPVARMAFNVLADDASSMSGTLVSIRYSCDVGYCTNECTCAPTGQVCQVNKNSTCAELNQLTLNGIRVLTYLGLSNVSQMFSTSAKCLEGHWELSEPNYLSNISRFEWSFSLLGKSDGEGIFNISTEPAWQDVGHNSKAIHCLPGQRLLLSGEQYVLHVRVWLSSDNYITFTSEPVLIDHTPPQSKLGKVVRDSDLTCARDIDYVTAQSSIQACWDGVFRDAQSNISRYELWVGTSPNADDYIRKVYLGLDTSFSISTNNFTEGTRYYVTVRAWNGAGLQTTVVSDGVTVDVTPPVSGVVFASKQNTNRRAQASNTTLSASWHSFQDKTSGVTSFQLAVKDVTNPSSPQIVVPFHDVGFVNKITLNDLNLRHKHSYSIAIKALDTAGLESKVADSMPIMVDLTPPEGVMCTDFRLYEQRTLSNILVSSPFFQTYGTIFRMNSANAPDIVKLIVTASLLQPGAKGYVAVEELKIPLFFKYSRLETVSAEHVMFTPSNNKSLNIVVEGNGAVNLSAELHFCSNSVVSRGDAVTIYQISQQFMFVSARIRDDDSGMKSMLAGIGTTAGGLQIQPLTLVTATGSAVFEVEVQHRSPLYATVIAENFAGQVERFVSQPLTMDRTPPLVSRVNISLEYDGEGEVNKTEVWVWVEWMSEDEESGVQMCTCQLEVQQSAIYSLQQTCDVNPGRCRWKLLRPRHRDNAYVKISCQNGMQMMTTVSSKPVTVILRPPDITEARITVLSNNHIMSPFDLSDPGVISYNSSLEFYVTGLNDLTGRQLQYRILRELSPLTPWFSVNVNKASAVLEKGVLPLSSGKITIEVRVLNERSFASDVVSLTVRLDDSKPLLSGKAVSWRVTEEKLEIDWEGVFNITRGVTFSVFGGTAHGYGDLVNHVVTKVTSLETSCAEQVSELYVAIKAVYKNGLSETYENIIVV